MNSVTGEDSFCVEGHCSWCLQFTSHIRVQHNIFRDAFVCKSCNRRSLRCIKSMVASENNNCLGMARGFLSGDDRRCFKCRGVIKDWEDEAQKKAINVDRKARCSWCLENTLHYLAEGDSYECGGCKRRTKVCSECKEAHAQGEDFIDLTKKCAKCRKLIDNWDDVADNAARMIKVGHCSWCFDYTNHRLEQCNSIRRNVYACQSCHARTLRCIKCDIGMTRGGMSWDDKFCVQCESAPKDFHLFSKSSDSKQQWSEMLKKKKEMAIRGWSELEAKSDLSRKSPQRDMAWAEGVLRPFLLLVSMSPIMRCRIASTLGICLLTEPYWGDSHAESWAVLNRNIHGLQARSNELKETLNPMARNCNWYEILRRSNVGGFAANMPKLTQSKTLDEPPLDDIEMEILGSMYEAQKSQFSPERLKEMEPLLHGAAMTALRARMADNGIRILAVQQLALESIANVLISHHSVTPDMDPTEQRNHIWQLLRKWVTMGDPRDEAVMESSATRSYSGLSRGGVAGAVAATIVGGPLFLLGAAWLGADAFRVYFGSSALRIAPVVGQLLMQRLLLALNGININDFFTDNEATGAQGTRAATRKGRWLSYSEFGDKSGVPIFFQHSLMASRLERHPDDSILVRLGVRLITVDRPGYGRSDPMIERSYHDWASDIADLADILGIEKFALFGFSSGGPYVYSCCRYLPHRVLAAAVVSADAPYCELQGCDLTDLNKALWYMSKSQTAQQYMLKPTLWAFAQMCHKDPNEYIIEMLGGDERDLAISKYPGVAEFVIAATREGCLQGVDGAVQDIVMERSPWGFALKEIQTATPLHIWHGEVDSQLSMDIALFSHRLINNSVIHIVRNESHHSTFIASWEDILTSLLDEAEAALANPDLMPPCPSDGITSVVVTDQVEAPSSALMGELWSSKNKEEKENEEICEKVDQNQADTGENKKEEIDQDKEKTDQNHEDTDENKKEHVANENEKERHNEEKNI